VGNFDRAEARDKVDKLQRILVAMSGEDLGRSRGAKKCVWA
jgi:hypothetical protein